MRAGAAIDEAVRQLAGIEGAAVRARRDELIRMVGLDPSLGERYPGELSGGQCQRLAIARTLAGEPKVLLCDEVTSALDVSAQAQIAGLLAALRRELGLAIVFVSHDLALVGGVCDRILVMRGGKIVKTGAAMEMLTAPREEHTKLLLSSVLSVEDGYEE